jgi:undecaprenyl-diphosphatase
VLDAAERLAGGATEEQKRQEAAAAPDPAAAIEKAAADGEASTPAGVPAAEGRAAAALVETAAQAVAPTPEASAVVEAAQEAPGGVKAPAGRRTERGRELLREAAIRRMGRLDALDARLFLLVNQPPHPAWLDRAAEAASRVTTGGWIWAALPAAGFLVGRRHRSVRAIADLLPVLAAVNLLVEHPIKAYFRRKRPFVHVVRAVVVGKKPGNWSFPSGHTATSFAAAWCLSLVWPGRAPVLLALASLVGVSRVYVGAHYPGDVVSGAVAGVTLAAIGRGLLRRVFSGMVRG